MVNLFQGKTLMKKTLLLLISLLALGQSAVSQSAFGLKASLNLSNHSKTVTFPQFPPPYKRETKPMLGYQFGAFYSSPIGSKLTVVAEANFSLIGSRNQYVTEQIMLNPDGKTYYYNDRIGYLEIPLILRYNFNKFYLGLGPSVAIKLFSKITNIENRTTKGFNYRSLDAAANVVVGYKISKKLEVNLRYSYGMMNILEDRFNQVTKNRFLNLSLLYLLKRK